MASSTDGLELQGSAARWGALWGARPDDWAYSEEQQVPTYASSAIAVRSRSGSTHPNR